MYTVAFATKPIERAIKEKTIVLVSEYADKKDAYKHKDDDLQKFMDKHNQNEKYVKKNSLVFSAILESQISLLQEEKNV